MNITTASGETVVCHSPDVLIPHKIGAHGEHEDLRCVSWMPGDLIEDEVRYYVGTEGYDEDEARELVTGDDVWLNECYSNVLERLTEVMQALNPNGYWYATVKNFGWRSLNGQKTFQADTASDVLSQVLPDTENVWNLWVIEEDGIPGLVIQNFHHDSPVGNEWYRVEPQWNYLFRYEGPLGARRHVVFDADEMYIDFDVLLRHFRYVLPEYMGLEAHYDRCCRIISVEKTLEPATSDWLTLGEVLDVHGIQCY